MGGIGSNILYKKSTSAILVYCRTRTWPTVKKSKTLFSPSFLLPLISEAYENCGLVHYDATTESSLLASALLARLVYTSCRLPANVVLFSAPSSSHQIVCCTTYFQNVRALLNLPLTNQFSKKFSTYIYYFTNLFLKITY